MSDSGEWMEWQPSSYLRRTVEWPAAARDPSGGEPITLGLQLPRRLRACPWLM
jgi:hypothetical protein